MAEGDLIGPYRLVSLLGKGAMGEVWRAHDARLDRYVALKVLPAGFAGDVERRARMLREARAAAAIRHANVVTLFDIVTHAGDDILVMELVEGRTLSETLRQDGPPPLELGLRWIEGISDALVAAHGRGILHRDIKAANIMVTPEGVKVLDFGLAKLVEGGTSLAPRSVPPHVPDGKIALDETMPSGPIGAASRSTEATWTAGPERLDQETGAKIDAAVAYRTHAGQLLGTPLYMAPEQIGGAAPDARSEVFSVGVVAHEILRGKPPYSATTIEALFVQISEGTPPALDEVPPGVAAIVRRAMAKDPGARYPTMSALRDAVVQERRQLFAPAARRGPLVLVTILAALAAGAGVWA
ncbi:MAG: protein kinase, partial [Kofleriaceae bacterium]